MIFKEFLPLVIAFTIKKFFDGCPVLFCDKSKFYFLIFNSRRKSLFFYFLPVKLRIICLVGYPLTIFKQRVKFTDPVFIPNVHI
ncbi:MAG: hypothetical protein D3906_11490 [Candidatus Electrothrix sp. AUS1_2]|nr:hypothetical protein [Candidatus Electrothrix sp. AUS1_2]